MSGPADSERLAALHALLRELRREGWDVGVEEHLVVQEAFLVLVARGAAGETPDDVADWLAPLIARSPHEQRDLRERLRRAGAPVVAPIADRGRGPARRAPSRTPAPGSRTVRFALAVLVVLALAVGALWARDVFEPPPPPPPAPVLEPEPGPPQPVVESVVVDAPTVPHSAEFRPVDVERIRSPWSPPVLLGHEDAVTFVSFSPQGQHLLTGSDDGTARLWDLDGGCDAVLAGHSKRLTQAAWSPDGTRVLTASEDGTARVWDVESGRNAVGYAEHTGRVRAAEWNAAGTHVVTGSDDGTARVWSAADGTTASVLECASPVTAVSWLSGGRVATGCEDGSVRIWRASQEQPEFAALQAHPLPIRAIAWHAGTRRLLVASEGGTVRVWDVEGPASVTVADVDTEGSTLHGAAWDANGSRFLTCADQAVQVWRAADGSQLARLPSARGAAQSAAWSPDGARIATAAWDGTVRLFDVASSQLLAVLLVGRRAYDGAGGTSGGMLSVSWSSDGAHIVCGDSHARATVFDASRFRTSVVWSGFRDWEWLRAVRWSPDGSRIVGVSRVGELVVVSRDGDGSVEIPLKKPAAAVAAWSPDGTRIATGAVYDASTGRELVQLSDERVIVSHVAWSPDGASVALATASDRTLVCDAVSGALLLELDGGATSFEGVAWSPDGRRLLLARARGAARVVDAATGAESTTLAEGVSDASAVAWRPDGRRIAAVGSDGIVRLHDPDDGSEQGRSRSAPGGDPSIAFAPTGAALLVTGQDGVARIFDGQSCALLRVLAGHDASVRRADWSPDGTRIVTASDDMTARVWDARTGALERVLLGHTGAVTDARFSPDGAFVATSSLDGTLRVWRVGAPAPSPLPFVAALAGVFLLGVVVRRGLARAYVRRGVVADDARPAFLTVPQHTRGSAVAPTLRADIARLRTHADVVTGDLDVERSVERTVAAGGLPTPVLRSRPQTPEYVALVDRRSATDAQADHVAAVLDRLESEGVHVERFEFSRDPRVVRRRGGERAERLDDLVGRLRDRRLLVFAEASTFRDPRGGAAPWLAGLDAWAQRCAVVPAARDEWSHEERAVLADGLAVAALETPARAAAPGDLAAFDAHRGASARAAFPPTLRAGAERWLASGSPPEHEVARVLGELRAYLGAQTYAWLCACAVYPQVHHGLTLRLGDLVFAHTDGSDAWTSADLARLVRLPWMRAGVFPDWLRRHLTEALPEPLAREIRARFLAWLAPGSADDVDALEVAVEERAWQWRLVAARSRAATADDPHADALRDAVLLGFADDGLGVRVRRSVAALLRRAPRAAAADAERRPERTWWRALPCTFGVAWALGWGLAQLGVGDVVMPVVAVYALGCGASAARSDRRGRWWLFAAELLLVHVGMLLGRHGTSGAVLDAARAATWDDWRAIFVAEGGVFAIVLAWTSAFARRHADAVAPGRLERALSALPVDRVVSALLADERPASERDAAARDAPPYAPPVWAAAHLVPLGWLALLAWRLDVLAPAASPGALRTAVGGVFLAAAGAALLVHLRNERRGALRPVDVAPRRLVVVAVACAGTWLGLRALAVSTAWMADVARWALLVWVGLAVLGGAIGFVMSRRRRAQQAAAAAGASEAETTGSEALDVDVELDWAETAEPAVEAGSPAEAQQAEDDMEDDLEDDREHGEALPA